MSSEDQEAGTTVALAPGWDGGDNQRVLAWMTSVVSGIMS